MEQQENWREVLPALVVESVASYGTRYSITKPWVQDGKVYATDGRILVWCNLPDGLVLAPPQNKTPPVQDVISQVKDLGAPLLFNRERVPSGDVSTCRRCDGVGLATCNLGHEHDCPACDGSGGERRGDDVGCWIADSLMLNSTYLRRLVRDSAIIQAQSRKNRPVKFTTPSGVSGLLMPMDPGGDREEPDVDLRCSPDVESKPE